VLRTLAAVAVAFLVLAGVAYGVAASVRDGARATSTEIVVDVAKEQLALGCRLSAFADAAAATPWTLEDASSRSEEAASLAVALRRCREGRKVEREKGLSDVLKARIERAKAVEREKVR
jgi:hypothetical protein